jgi:hypothetical protein
MMATLDRVLATIDWESKFPLASVNTLSKEVSDHNPLRVNFGAKLVKKEPIFRFEKWWFDIEGFADLVKKTWGNDCPSNDPMEVWQFKIRLLGKKIKGWGRNVGAEIRRQKKDMIDQIDRLDLLAEQKILTAHETGET